MEEEAESPDSEKQTYPSELRGPLPRRVQMNSPNASFVLVVVVVCLGLGSIAVGYDCFSILKQIGQRTDLRRDGRDTVGRVSAMHSGRGGSTVRYTFTANGTNYLGKAQMPNYRLVLHESDQIAVRYLPSDPTVNHPADWEWSGLTDVIPEALALFFVAVGSVALVVLLRDRKLAREGKVAEGIVTDCAADKQQFRVEYQFSTDDGARIEGHSSCSERYEVGACIWIIYLAKKPRRNHSYPLELFRVAE
jgi:hypothetical protein